MKITFTETGGLLGKTKKAEINFDLSAKAYKALLKEIAFAPKKEVRKSKDALSYYLSKDGEEKATKISITNIPDAYRKLFDKLFMDLKTV